MEEYLMQSRDLPKAPSAESIRAWLVSALAEHLRVPVAGIDVQAPFTRYGIDSITALLLVADLELWLGRRLSLTLLYRYNSIETLVQHLVEGADAEEGLAAVARARDDRAEYPLSYGQRALWFLHQLDPQSAAYTIMFAVRILSTVDLAALRRAFQFLVNRHASLRTTFTPRAGEPVQVVHDHVEVSFHHVDACGWSQEDVHRRLVEQAHRPFDLERGPLFKVSLFTQSAQEHVLLLTVHHIVADLWSLVVLMDELRVLYPLLRAGALVHLPSLHTQYADFVQWQAEMLAGPQGQRLAAYWETQLAGDLPVLNLPTDRPRPPVQTYYGASHPFRISQELTWRLESLAKDAGVTLYILLLASFQVLLHRYTGQDDILVGSPMAGRSRPEFFGIVGYLVNPVVLRANLSGNPPFKLFLAQVRDTVLEALEHQDYAFPLLVERLLPARDASRSPIFQAMFALEKPHRLDERGIGRFVLGREGGQVNLGGLVLEPVALEQRAAQFDLTLTMVEVGETFLGSWQYNTDLFSATTIAKMAGHFETLLECIAAHADQPVASLPLLAQEERQQILVEWNDTQADYPQDACLQQLFEAQVERTPDATAVVFEGQSLAYAELNRRANQLAHYLCKLGTGSDELVGICVERSPEMVVAMLGVLKAGAAFVPLDPTYPQARLAFMVQDARLSALLTQEWLLKTLPTQGARTTICLDADWASIAQESDENPVAMVMPDDLAYVIYTSGSTGQPKGVLLRHRGLCNLAAVLIEMLQVNPESRVLQFASFSFDASISEMVMALLSGARLVLIRPQMLGSLPALAELMRGEGITTVTLPPSMLQVLSPDDVPTVQAVVSAGETLPWEAALRWSVGRLLFNGYGPTETTIGTSYYQVTDRLGSTASVPIGRPIANTQMYLLDRNKQPVPIGVPGEIYIGGVGVGAGYLNRPELTAAAFVTSPFGGGSEVLYKTGDLARRLPDGNIEFLGRIDHQVKIRGFRIELGEIEAILKQHPAVREAIVLPREDVPGDGQGSLGDKRLVAYVAPRAGLLSGNELRTFLQEQVPAYMVPSAFVVLEALPLTPNGKVDRRGLPAPDPANLSSENEITYAPPCDRLEFQLARTWEEVLGMPVGIHDNFFDLGGHSLLALRLVAKIEQAFGTSLSADTLFQAPTVEQLAAILRRGGDVPAWSSLMALQPGGSRPPFFCVAASYGDLLAFVELARHLGKDQPFFRLQPPGSNGNGKSIQRVQALAAHYLDELRTVQPAGPYYVGGYSAGGLVAWEVARQLQAQGQPVALLALLDTHDPAAASVNAMIYHIGQALVDRFPPLGRLFKLRVFQNVFEDRGMRVSLEAQRSYSLGAYSGKTALFLADRSPVKRSQAARRWRKLAAGGLGIYRVPGSHHSFIREPNVSVLAEQLRRCLAEASRDHA